MNGALKQNTTQLSGGLGGKNSGLSAYEVWLAAGNTGTVEAFWQV